MSGLTTFLGLAIAALGLLMTFLGARLAKPVLFLTSFILAGLVGAEILERYAHVQPGMVNVGGAIIGVAAGVLSVIFFKVGIFLLGMFALTGMADMGASLLKYDVPPLYLAGAGLVGGVIGLVLERRILVFATAALGSTLALMGVYLLLLPSGMPSGDLMKELADYGNPSAMARVLYLVGWVALWAAGVRVQSLPPRRGGGDEDE